ncbi:hypothetical protein Tco_0927476 [Tanacetum coccineum]
MFSNPLFYDSSSSDGESNHEEVIHEMSFKAFSNPLFDRDEEIISSEFNPIHNEDLDFNTKNDRFDTESYLLESLLNRDALMEVAIRQLTPVPPEDFQANSDTIIETHPTFPIPFEDSNSLREEIDIFPGPDDSILPGIKNDDFNSKDDDNSTSLPEFELFHVDYPDLGDSIIDVVEDIPVDVPNILATHPTLLMDFDFIPSHNDLGSNLDISCSSLSRDLILTYIFIRNEVMVAFHNHGCVLDYMVISPPSSSQRRIESFPAFSEMHDVIHGDNTPNLGVRHLHFYPP